MLKICCAACSAVGTRSNILHELKLGDEATLLENLFCSNDF